MEQLRIRVDVVEQRLRGERRGPQRLIHRIVQIASEALAFLGRGQLGDPASQLRVGQCGAGLVSDRPEPVSVIGREEAGGGALDHQVADQPVGDLHACPDRRPRRAERVTRLVDDDGPLPVLDTLDDGEGFDVIDRRRRCSPEGSRSRCDAG